MSQLRLQDACNLLGIVYPVEANRREVSRSYNAKAKANHPDKVPATQKRAASKRMQALNDARDLLYTLHERKAWQGKSAPLLYSEQALIRIWAWGVGLHIILNRRRVGVAIILNGPFLFFFLCAWWGIYTP